MFTITAYKVVFFICLFLFRRSAMNRCQSIPVYLSIGMDDRYLSITTEIFAIDWPLIININRLIDIDCHPLSVLSIGYPGNMCSLLEVFLAPKVMHDFLKTRCVKALQFLQIIIMHSYSPTFWSIQWYRDYTSLVNLRTFSVFSAPPNGL